MASIQFDTDSGRYRIRSRCQKLVHRHCHKALRGLELFDQHLSEE